MSQTQSLFDSISSLRERIEDVSGPLSGNAEQASRLVAQVGEIGAGLDGISARMNDDLADRLGKAVALTAEAAAQAGNTDAQLAKLDERLAALQGLAASLDDIGRSGMAEIDSSLASAGERLTTLTSRIDESRAKIRAIETEAEDVGFKASSTLLDALGRARDSASQAAEHVRSALSGVVEEAQASLNSINDETLRSAVDEAIGARLAALKSAGDEAVAAAQSAAERLARQMLTIAETTASVEARIAETNEQVETQNQEEFSRRSALLIEALNSTAIDIAKVLSNDLPDTAWASYLKGDRSIFVRRTVKLIDSGEARAIQRHYEEEPEFRDQLNRYVHDFEAMIRRVLAERDGGPMAVALLSSDIGKLYVALAQAIERLRT